MEVHVKYVKRLATASQSERREQLMCILREEQIPFIHYHNKYNEHWVDNIVVSINPSSSRLVIGAHYDSIEGSTGANDNAAAVSILIKLTKELLKCQGLSVDVAFFDREEYIDKGSEQYIQNMGKENIKAMINLDICGFGENIAIAAKGNLGNSDFRKMFTNEVIKKHSVILLGFLPTGDDMSFCKAEIPNISVAMLASGDIKVFDELAECIEKGIELSKEKEEQYLLSLECVTTMHGGQNDNISIVSEKSMNKLYNYLVDGLL
jgi:hypothetical protein